MSRLDTLKEKLAKREPVLSTTLANIGWTGLVQKAAASALDFIVYDLEHGTLSIEGIEAGLRIARLTDLPTVVRIPDCVPHLISKTLDMGADGILIPRVERMEQVETAIRCARYYPRGRKGCGGFSNLRAEDQGSVACYNDNRLIFIQMESNEGLAILPEILATYGSELAGVIIGPYDTSIMIGTPLDICSDVMTDFIRKVFSTCAAAGMSCGSFVDDETMIPRYRDLGGNIFWTDTEMGIFSAGLKSLCKAFQKETAK